MPVLVGRNDGNDISRLEDVVYFMTISFVLGIVLDFAAASHTYNAPTLVWLVSHPLYAHHASGAEADPDTI